MTASSKFKVGDEVLIIALDRRMGDPRKGVVTKVGRTRVTVEEPDQQWGRPRQFHMDGGHNVGDYTDSRVVTVEDYAEEQRVAELRERLKEVGVVIARANGWLDAPLSSTALAEILDVVVRDRKANPS